jgi:hypothetical protein
MSKSKSISYILTTDVPKKWSAMQTVANQLTAEPIPSLWNKDKISITYVQIIIMKFFDRFPHLQIIYKSFNLNNFKITLLKKLLPMLTCSCLISFVPTTSLASQKNKVKNIKQKADNFIRQKPNFKCSPFASAAAGLSSQLESRYFAQLRLERANKNAPKESLMSQL